MTSEILEEQTEKKSVRGRAKGGMTGKKVKIKILAQEGEQGDVFLALNGHGLQIKRGEVVEIDEAFVHILNDSIIDTVISDFDEHGKRVSKAVQMQRFPYQIVG